MGTARTASPLFFLLPVGGSLPCRPVSPSPRGPSPPVMKFCGSSSLGVGPRIRSRCALGRAHGSGLWTTRRASSAGVDKFRSDRLMAILKVSGCCASLGVDPPEGFPSFGQAGSLPAPRAWSRLFVLRLLRVIPRRSSVASVGRRCTGSPPLGSLFPALCRCPPRRSCLRSRSRVSPFSALELSSANRAFGRLLARCSRRDWLLFVPRADPWSDVRLASASRCWMGRLRGPS